MIKEPLALITQFFSFKIDSELKHTFKAGQWVDFFIPGMDKIGGFSMSSHPSLLTEKQVLNHSLQAASVKIGKILREILIFQK